MKQVRSYSYSSLRTRDHLDRDPDDFAGILDPVAVLRAAARTALRRSGVDVAMVGAVADDVDTLQLGSFCGNRTDSLQGLRVPAGTGLGGKVSVLRHPIWTPDYSREGGITHDFDIQVEAEGLRGMLAVPIVSGYRLAAVLYLATRAPTDFGDRVADVAEGVARRAGLAISVAEQAAEMSSVAVHQDRQQMAVRLHDSVGARLFSIGAALRDLRAEVPPDLLEKIAFLEEQTSAAAVTLRRTLKALSQPPERQALTTAMQADCRALEDRSGIQAALVVIDDPPPLDPGAFSALLQAEREALLNVEKHARATSVVVTVHCDGDGVAVAVSDDGIGLSASGSSDGIGTGAASERLQRMGGSLTLIGNEDGGCTMRAWVPCR